MSDNRAKVRLRIGQLEVEYEGHASFLKDDLVQLMQRMIDLHTQNHVVLAAVPPQEGGAEGSVKPMSSVEEMSIRTVAQRLNATSGPDVVLAAAAHLTIFQGQEVFSRQQILDNIKKAHGYYKKSMAGNLSGSLQSLLKQDQLREPSDENYALAVAGRTRIDAALADDN